MTPHCKEPGAKKGKKPPCQRSDRTEYHKEWVSRAQPGNVAHTMLSCQVCSMLHVDDTTVPPRFTPVNSRVNSQIEGGEVSLQCPLKGTWVKIDAPTVTYGATVQGSQFDALNAEHKAAYCGVCDVFGHTAWECGVIKTSFRGCGRSHRPLRSAAGCPRPLAHPLDLYRLRLRCQLYLLLQLLGPAVGLPRLLHRLRHRRLPRLGICHSRRNHLLHQVMGLLLG